MNDICRYFNQQLKDQRIKFWLQFVLFGFMKNLSRRFFASLPIKSKSFMQYTG